MSNSDIIVSGGQKNDWDLPLQVKIEDVHNYIIKNYLLSEKFYDWEIFIKNELIMKIFDCTTYFEEDLMMDLRFNILNNYVDKFIVSEATFTHSGNDKKIRFDPNNFKKFKEKIIHVIIEKDPVNRDEKNH